MISRIFFSIFRFAFVAINGTIEQLKSEGLSCNGYVVDISNRENVVEAAKTIKNEIGNVDILINNAGIVCCKPFWDLSEKIIENTYAVNILSHYWVSLMWTHMLPHQEQSTNFSISISDSIRTQTAKAFLPEMMESNRGHIVTVASVAGMLGTYGCTDYSATKFACIGFHEALFTELRTHGYDDIHMTLVCPYYIASGMFAGVKPRMFPMLTPKYVADQITLSVQKNEVNCTMPHSIRMLVPLKW